MLHIYKRCSISTRSPLSSSFKIYCLCPALRTCQSLASSLFHAPAQQLLMCWIQSQTPWLRPGVHCTYYSRHPVIYFSSELIVKSIRSREKTLTQACHEKQGNRGSFPSQPVHPGKAGGRKMLPHLVFRRQKLPSSVEGTRCSGPIFLLRVFSLIPLDKNLSFRNPLWV